MRLAVARLEQGNEDAEGPQGPIGHVRCEETPGMIASDDLLAEFDRFLVPDRFGLNPLEARYNFGQIFFDTKLEA
jgi:hypothetical protein